MKNIITFWLLIVVLLIGCQSKDAGSQQVQPVVKPNAQATAEVPATPPPPTPTYDIVKMGDGHEMVRVAAGEFKRGSDSGEADEKPVRNISLSEFLIDRYEVSNADFAKCVAAKKCIKAPVKPGFNAPDQPAGALTWAMAQAYCKSVGERMPTEAEWEKAAHGTDTKVFPWGDNATTEYATYAAKTTTPVTSNPKGVSPYGVFNMAGNVAEWVADVYQADYYASSPAQTPTGPAKAGKNSYRILRGGSYMSSANHVRTTYRQWERGDYQYPGYGVRCAK